MTKIIFSADPDGCNLRFKATKLTIVPPIGTIIYFSANVDGAIPFARVISYEYYDHSDTFEVLLGYQDDFEGPEHWTQIMLLEVQKHGWTSNPNELTEALK